MAKRASPGLVGAFVIMGLTLVVLGIVGFSSAQLFSSSKRFILYFDETLTGLDVGAAVKFRGVTIGKVVDILIHYNQPPEDLHMPVVVEVEESRLRSKSDASVRLAEHAAFEELLDRGLRGRLETESLLTGRLYVNLELVADADPPQFHQVKPIYQEIPTLPTQIQQFVRNISEIDFASLVKKTEGVVNKLDLGLQQIHFAEIQGGLTNALKALTQLIRSSELTNSLHAFQQTMDEYRALAGDVRQQVLPLSSSAQKTLAEADRAITELRTAVEELRSLLSPRAPLQRDVSATLDELSRAARSIRQLSEFLSNHPDALLTGKKPSSLPP